MSPPASALIRDVARLQAETFDVLIVGGGIDGAYCVLDAATRGLKAALIESHDFACATSANSAKVAHSGVRYLQHGDLKRLRKSARERAALFANAPHIMKHVPVLMPVRGHGLKGRETVRIYTALYDWLSREWRAADDPERAVPASRMLSREDAMLACPLIASENLTGGAVWPEGLVTNTERLVIGALRAAAARGAVIANRIEAEELFKAPDGTVQGVFAQDNLSGAKLTIQARAVIDATGPLAGWTGAQTRVPLARAFGLVTRSLCEGHVLSFPVPPTYQDSDALVDRGESLQFAVPWRGKSILGTMHLPLEGAALDARITQQEVERYLQAVNRALPDAKLKLGDVYRVFWGVLPAARAGSPNPEKQGRVLDHGALEGLRGLFGIAGVKLTEARALAEEALDAVCAQLGIDAAVQTLETSIWGGDIARLKTFRQEAERVMDTLPRAARSRLIQHYGTGYSEVLRFAGKLGPLEFVAGTHLLKGEVLYAIDYEQAWSLADVVLRRTDLGSASVPPAPALDTIARLMAGRLGWDEARIRSEIAAVEMRSNYTIFPEAAALRSG
ncbi:glycerol-3-phosphate dehydrogenase/oxidase [Altererythrobacter sp. GH1-8]|uniref:glycerol-3-phosphate dehydrogenase/oxidase n=1 Tax=Altererythrobacter sp. GH1-8 TaxID=3349333 RepID=UPI00374D96DD